jgi:hypothetical protein
VYDDTDVRYRTLGERLELAARRLPPGFRVKPYRVATATENARVCAQALLQELASGQQCDGLIALNTSAPYWEPPLKYKEIITCDFLLEEAANGDGFILLSGGGGRPPPEAEERCGASLAGWSGSPGWESYRESYSESYRESYRESWSQTPGTRQDGRKAPWKALPWSARREKDENATGNRWGTGKSRANWGARKVWAGAVRSPMKRKSGRTRRGFRKGGYRASTLEVHRDGPRRAVARVRPPPALLAEMGISANVARSDLCVVECARSGDTWSLKRRRMDRTNPNSSATVALNMKLSESCCTKAPWFLQSLPLQNEALSFSLWLEACHRCVIYRAPTRGKRLVEIGVHPWTRRLCSAAPTGSWIESVRAFAAEGEEVSPVSDKAGGGHKTHAARRDSAAYSVDCLPYDGSVCDRIISFFSLYPYFKSRETLRRLALDVAQSGATLFSGLMWSADAGDVHSPGRYSLKTEPPLSVSYGPVDRSDFLSTAYGRKMRVELPGDPTPTCVWAGSIDALTQAFAEVDFALVSAPQLPAPVECNGCPSPFDPLARRLLHFSFARAP